MEERRRHRPHRVGEGEATLELSYEALRALVGLQAALLEPGTTLPRLEAHMLELSARCEELRWALSPEDPERLRHRRRAEDRRLPSGLFGAE